MKTYMITTDHMVNAHAVIAAFDHERMPRLDTAHVALCVLALLADTTPEPGKAIDNFIAALAQILPTRSTLGLAVLDLLADKLEEAGLA